MSDIPKVVFLHGLGETCEVWNPIVKQLPQTECAAPEVLKVKSPMTDWSLEGISNEIADTFTEPVHLVGLSLGAVIALQIAITHPEKVVSLFISAPQAKLPKLLMSLQRVLMRLLPAKWVCPPQLSKADLFGVLDSLKYLDLTAQLPALRMPVTVVCGSRDKANLPASRKIARLIPGARFAVVPGVGHQWHATHPQLFAEYLQRAGTAQETDGKE
ncbi:alpha/beta fold hydrolase [Mobiluncus curtisii]|uniref:alpha/beta fold hydrolase n=1 Tax=Mobiluncus curtisii TaxID=2051 RepID=UPI00147060B2|nr:alpha/beta hydrolase [Mobiluncus curtisii]MCV0021290.1 alpha/beta fold hydrolase [Mobiluncus curtisii]NMW43184.1 alpha/beta fold hydrolase [Mobiluncus curtisii]NMW47290.1 alpha/beta fold hydrolase [Mobiluncus curtisii]NMW82871.1 alpha/beta fold hydrolase [Mobiluncus curtisii]NMW99771.1 alpha/beta fold hydrolase [Mobiluncus curtisii]